MDNLQKVTALEETGSGFELYPVWLQKEAFLYALSGELAMWFFGSCIFLGGMQRYRCSVRTVRHDHCCSLHIILRSWHCPQDLVLQSQVQRPRQVF